MKKIVYNGQTVVDLEELSSGFSCFYKLNLDFTIDYNTAKTYTDEATLNKFQPALDMALEQIKDGKAFNLAIYTGKNHAQQAVFSHYLTGSLGSSNYQIAFQGLNVFIGDNQLSQTRVPTITFVCSKSDHKLSSVSVGSIKLLSPDNNYRYQVENEYAPAHKQYVDLTVANSKICIGSSYLYTYTDYDVTDSAVLSENIRTLLNSNATNSAINMANTVGWSNILLEVHAPNVPKASGIYRGYLDESSGADYNLIFNSIDADNKNKFIGYVSSLITEFFFGESSSALELNGTYNDIDVTAGYDFSVEEVNDLIDTLNKTPQMIQVNLTREFGSRTDINSVMADIGFNKSVPTDGTTTEEVSLHYVVVSQGMYLRFYGSATLTDGHITSPLHCFSEDYNG